MTLENFARLVDMYDPLEAWKGAHPQAWRFKYKRIWTIARRVMAHVSVNAFQESVFSRCEKTLGVDRGNLSSELREATAVMSVYRTMCAPEDNEPEKEDQSEEDE